MEVNRREIYRYLGYKNQEAEGAVMELTEQCLKELECSASMKHITREYPLAAAEPPELDFTCFRTRSSALTKNLQDCDRIILFAATLGAEVDVLLHRYSRLQMSKAVVMQAAAAAMIEEYCDTVNEALRSEYEARGLYLRPRFSPGYGDFQLECQKDIAAALEMGKRIGIKLTDSLLMAPSKSVTAVIGVSRKPHRCEIKGCELCKKTDCAYRRG